MQAAAARSPFLGGGHAAHSSATHNKNQRQKDVTKKISNQHTYRLLNLHRKVQETVRNLKKLEEKKSESRKVTKSQGKSIHYGSVTKSH
jgi:hypothetical protein